MRAYSTRTTHSSSSSPHQQHSSNIVPVNSISCITTTSNCTHAQHNSPLRVPSPALAHIPLLCLHLTTPVASFPASSRFPLFSADTHKSEFPLNRRSPHAHRMCSLFRLFCVIQKSRSRRSPAEIEPLFFGVSSVKSNNCRHIAPHLHAAG